MLLGCVVCGFILGIIVGFFLMKYSNKNISSKNRLKKNLDKHQEQLINYQLELQQYFLHSMKLLENLAKDYHNLHQYTLKSSQNLLVNQKNTHHSSNSIFKNLCNYELSSDKIQPIDYPLQKNDNIIIKKNK